MFNYPDPTETYEEIKEVSNHDLFHEFENMPDEAINYVNELELKIRMAKEELSKIHLPEHLTFYQKKLIQ